MYEIRGSRDDECKNYGLVGYKTGGWVPYYACLSGYRKRVPSYTSIGCRTLESSLSKSHVFIHHIITYGSNTAQRMIERGTLPVTDTRKYWLLGNPLDALVVCCTVSTKNSIIVCHRQPASASLWSSLVNTEPVNVNIEAAGT